MPLYKTITINSTTKLYIWKIEESYETLSKGIALSDFCKKRVSSMKSDAQRCRFLSIRHLLKIAGYCDKDVYYDPEGKPHLKDNHYISMTHSYHFSGIIVGNLPVGIDIEKKREKILRIANRFTPLTEYKTLANDEAVIRKLTIVWGAKEAIYKVMNIPGLLFLQNIYVEDFDFEEGQTTATVNYNHKNFDFYLKFMEFEDFTCVYALPKPSDT